MKRRSFLKVMSLAASAPMLVKGSALEKLLLPGDEDAALCLRKFKLAVSLDLQKKPIGEVIVAMGKSFIGTEYVAHTLEVPGKEHLVVNLRGLDCVSFCENALVFARCIKKNKMTFNDYKADLQFIRYRGGVIDRYPSRLHYFSDYIYDNVKKGVLKDMTGEIGGVPYKKTIDFMSTHPESYRQLTEHPEFIEIIRRQEAAISARKMVHIPKENVEKVSAKIHGGDIIAITTDIPGIDISHTGVAVWQDGKLHFMHAPNVGFKVQITEKTLADYLAGNKKQLGIMVARAVEPA
jgi:hypothetical protein